MGEDASLDQFIGGESDERSEESTGDGATEQPAAGSGPDEAAGQATEPEPDEAATTYAWSDNGTTCERCGETVERRWQQDGRLVCPGCKDWAQG